MVAELLGKLTKLPSDARSDSGMRAPGVVSREDDSRFPSTHNLTEFDFELGDKVHRMGERRFIYQPVYVRDPFGRISRPIQIPERANDGLRQ